LLKTCLLLDVFAEDMFTVRCVCWRHVYC